MCIQDCEGAISETGLSGQLPPLKQVRYIQKRIIPVKFFFFFLTCFILGAGYNVAHIFRLTLICNVIKSRNTYKTTGVNKKVTLAKETSKSSGQEHSSNNNNKSSYLPKAYYVSTYLHASALFYIT